jgi:hypothetical protein
MSAIVAAPSTGTSSSPSVTGLPWCRARRVDVSRFTHSCASSRVTAPIGQAAHSGSQCVRHSEAFLTFVTASMPRARVTRACQSPTLISPRRGLRNSRALPALPARRPTCGRSFQAVRVGVAAAVRAADCGLPLARGQPADIAHLTDLGGEATAKDVKAAASRAGFADRTLDRARSRAGVTTGRTGFGKGAIYVWRLNEAWTPHARHARQDMSPGGHDAHGGGHGEHGSS